MYLCIVGTSRSGSTLFRDLMNSGNLKTFNETQWLPSMYELYGDMKVPYQWLLDVAKETRFANDKDLFTANLEGSRFTCKDSLLDELELKLKALVNTNIQDFYEVYAETLLESDLWGDKTPDYGYYMTTIQRLWSRCKFIHVVRDGVPTAHSMSKHLGCQLMTSNGYDNYCNLSYRGLYSTLNVKDIPLNRHIEAWCRRMRRIRNESTRLQKGTYLEIRYEALLTDPIATLKTVENYLDIDLGISQEYVESTINKDNLKVRNLSDDQLVSLSDTDIDLLKSMKAEALMSRTRC